MSTCLRILCLLSSLLCVSALAEPISYFTAEVPVKSQSRGDQQAASEKGLIDMLVRVSGSEVVRDNALIADRANQALSYVSEFQYAELDDPTLKAEGYRHILKLRFSSRLVRALLAEAGLPVWSVNRPVTLVWLVEDSLEFGKRMMPYDLENPIFQGIEQAAQYRGLPLMYPLLDFDDQLAVGAEGLWQLDEEAIRQASARYKADVILVGKYSALSSGQLYSTWHYFHDNRANDYDLRSEAPEQIGYNAVLPLADFLAARYSYHAEDAEYFSLNVANIQSFADYKSLISTLKSFDTITDVKIDLVQNSEISLRLKSEASLDQVTNQIALARKLFVRQNQQLENLPKWEQADLGSPQNPLRYSWQR